MDASVNEEADPLGIVPTASFAAAAALGDAIGSALMKRRKFDSNEYAKTHPAGQLGRNLILKVEDVYHNKTKVACLAKDAKLKEAVIEMSKYPLGAACVLENGKLLGIITDGDLRRTILETEDLNQACVSEIMTNEPTTVFPNKSLGFALDLMEKRKTSPISLLPVVNPKTKNFLGLFAYMMF